MTFTVRWITSIDALRALGPRYDSLVLSSGDAGTFHERGWIERAWPYFESLTGAALAFVLVERGEEMVAVAPLQLRTRSWLHARQRVLEFLGGTWDELDDWMPGILYLATDVDARNAALDAIVRTVAEGAWDLLELRLVRDSDPTRERLLQQIPSLQISPDRLVTPRVRLDTGWGDYWRERSRRLLRMVERGRKRAAEEGLDVTHEVTSEVPAARRGDVAAMHRARQERIRAGGRQRNSPFDNVGSERTFWDLVDWSAAQGRLRLHWLRIGGRPAAYVMVLHHAGTSFAWFNAIDPAAERYHPGSLVLAGLIEREATDHGARIVDLMVGANVTKSLFATEEIRHWHLSAVNPLRPSAAAKYAWVRGLRRLSRAIGRG